MSSKDRRKQPQKRVMRGTEYRDFTAKTPVIRHSGGSAGVRAVKGVFSTIGKVLLTIFLICIIIGCIVGTALTVFVMKYVDSDTGIDLATLDVYSTSVVYGLNADGEATPMQSLHLNGRREWVDLEDIPKNVQDAFIYTEDERFMEHEGVDWGRTISSFLKLVFSQDASQGGSTITQQLIKNINGDFNNRTVDVKIREILGALQLERHNTKSAILEAYLNYVDLGNGNYGVQAAAEYYFDKDVSELTDAEAASLAATTKSPSAINIAANPERNEERRAYTLSKMLEFSEETGMTQERYEAALNEEIVVIDRTGENAQVLETDHKIYNWYVDTTIEKVAADLVEQYGMTSAEAWNKINGGGLQIYTTCQIDMQNYLESYFLDDSNFYYYELENPPEGAAIIMDYQGNVQAIVGSRNEKTENRALCRAADDVRSAGSAMKPITTYAPAINSDLITFSTMMVDEPKMELNGNPWPGNYEDTWSRRGITMVEALRVSKNTIPVELYQRLGGDYCYNFLKDTLHITTLGSQNDREPLLTLGMTDYGVKLDELCAAYSIFGNNGYYNTPKYYTKVVDMNGNVLLETEAENSYAIDASSAYIMNKMMDAVVNQGGTGRQAQMNKFRVVGKTGTSDDNLEFSFVGLNPYYIMAIRFAYDQNTDMSKSERDISNKVYKPQTVYKDIMTDLLEGYESADFEDMLDHSDVVEKRYCTVSGMIAGPNCGSTKVGYYKKTNIPQTCTMSHY